MYLINYDFKENGRGIDIFSYRLYNELRKRNLDIEKIEINNFYKRTLRYVKPIFIFSEVIYETYNYLVFIFFNV